MSDYERTPGMIPFPDTGHSPQKHAFWRIIQPIKIDSKYLHNDYPEEELELWKHIITTNVDGQLSTAADNEFGSTEQPVDRLLCHSDMFPISDDLNSTLVALLSNDTDISYVGFANGIIPHLTYVYHSFTKAAVEAQKRMFSVIVGGTDGSNVQKTMVLSHIPVEVPTRGIVVAHDDVGDTMAALAAFTESVLTMKNNDHPYDEALVQKLSETFGRGYTNFGPLYEQLIDSMEQTGVVAAIPLYKNREFVDHLIARVKRRTREAMLEVETDRWTHYQGQLLDHKRIIPEDAWVMGEGLDTGIEGKKIASLLSDDLINNPSLTALIDRLTLSRIRVGSTIRGLVVLRHREDGSEGAVLTAWVAKQIEAGLREHLQSRIRQN